MKHILILVFLLTNCGVDEKDKEMIAEILKEKTESEKTEEKPAVKPVGKVAEKAVEEKKEEVVEEKVDYWLDKKSGYKWFFHSVVNSPFLPDGTLLCEQDGLKTPDNNIMYSAITDSSFRPWAMYLPYEEQEITATNVNQPQRRFWSVSYIENSQEVHGPYYDDFRGVIYDTHSKEPHWFPPASLRTKSLSGDTLVPISRQTSPGQQAMVNNFRPSFTAYYLLCVSK
jgi:hypothetical protein